MKYIKYTIKTIKTAEDIIAAGLNELDIAGVEIEDSSLPDDIRENGTFYDVLPENSIKGEDAYISFYTEDSKDREAVLRDVNSLLKELSETLNLGEWGIDVSETEDRDWLNNWKEFFKSFVIDLEGGKKALFQPSWDQSSDNGAYDYVINIDPGTAFGTGAHESTRLCITALHKYIRPGMRFLDVGTGSGILSLLAFMFGAARGTGTDVDQGSVPAVKDNFSKNRLEEADFRFLIGNILDDDNVRDAVGYGYDLVVANILPDVLGPLTGYIPQVLKKDGIYIISGIIEGKALEMRKCLEFNDFSIIEETKDGEWVSYVSVLR